jgi:hypothetical protein
MRAEAFNIVHSQHIVCRVSYVSVKVLKEMSMICFDDSTLKLRSFENLQETLELS